MKTRKNISILLVLLLGVLLNFSPVHAKDTAKLKKRHISSEDVSSILAKYKIRPEQVSIQIIDDVGEILSLNSSIKKSPASLSKLITTFAVLKRLPLGHKFYTRLYRDSKNLYLQGGGDPAFVSENLWYMVNELTRSGLKTVQGNIIVDDSLFDKIRFDESRHDKRVDRAYDSPVGAMSFNWNAVNIFVKPGVLGEKAHVTADPDSDYFSIVNNTMTVAGTSKTELKISISNSEKLITVSGEVIVGEKEKLIYKSIDEPDLWSGTNLVSFMEQRDIITSGYVVAGRVPDKAELLVTLESKSLSAILADMNKYSNNFVAEMLTKAMAVQEQKSGATLKRGVEMINEELVKIGISRDEILIVNPSGLTSNNLISAASLNRVLSHIKKDFSIYPTFLEGLPIAGIDGTLKKRMKGSLAEGWVRAKTGTLTGAVSLAGYAGRRDGQVLTFSFLYNGPQSETNIREAFDQLIINSLK